MDFYFLFFLSSTSINIRKNNINAQPTKLVAMVILYKLLSDPPFTEIRVFCSVRIDTIDSIIPMVCSSLIIMPFSLRLLT